MCWFGFSLSLPQLFFPLCRSLSQPAIALLASPSSTSPVPTVGKNRKGSALTRSRSHIQEATSALSTSPTALPTTGSSVSSAGGIPIPAPTSTGSSSPSLQGSAGVSPKAKRLSRSSTTGVTGVTRRRLSETQGKRRNGNMPSGEARLSDSVIDVATGSLGGGASGGGKLNAFDAYASSPPAESESDVQQHLKELQAQLPRLKTRSDSLSRLRDSAASLSLDSVSSNGSNGSSAAMRGGGGDDSLTRIANAFKGSTLRIPGEGGGSSNASSPGGTPSSGSSPSISPMGSPRSSGTVRSGSKLRYLTRAVEQLDSGDKEGWKSSLLDSRLMLVGALFDVASEDEWSALAENLVIVFEQNHRSIRLMIWALRKEVASTVHEHDMFRLDSAASKLMGFYGQMVAGAFLKDLLKSTIMKKLQKALAKTPDDVPTPVIWKMIDSMLATLISKMGSFPFQMRVLCFYIKEEVVKRFPGKGNIGVGAFLFLRLICPAIVAPEVRGVTRQEPSPAMRKVLVRVARELQQLVNIANRGDSLSVDLYGDSTEQVTFVGCNVQRIKVFLDGVGTKSLEEIDPAKTSVFSNLSPLRKSKSTLNSLTTSGDLGGEGEAAMEAIAELVRAGAKKAEAQK